MTESDRRLAHERLPGVGSSAGPVFIGIGVRLVRKAECFGALGPGS